MNENPWRSRLLLLGTCLIVFGILTMPIGILGFLFGIYCISYGLRIPRGQVVKHSRQPQYSQQQKQPVQPEIRSESVSKPPLPKDRIAEYRSRIQELESLEKQADRRLESLTQYLNQIFSDSQITKDRYLDIVRKAEGITDVNLKKARTALAMFADGPVTPQRLEILDGYVDSSRQMLSRIDSVVTELMRAEQYGQLRDTQSIEEAMNELKETAKYYAQ